MMEEGTERGKVTSMVRPDGSWTLAMALGCYRMLSCAIYCLFLHGRHVGFWAGGQVSVATGAAPERLVGLPVDSFTRLR